ncbi:ABC-F family ATP-binding cassette domain-containing protein [Chondrinema litorale]|uniref:ABC-F family ATP-binding cassette domain-containing protein n=1 Tax=Chondrinema litorale TaxID=2994555 RepID=UPI00254368FB|nr:ABC-F family ATP-binding cassette domain-containing protein [Chondrinema litorale]UZR95697.1 ABC-F family ATP-binding cassette domain-containing protein [Chondrinema litorale]
MTLVAQNISYTLPAGRTLFQNVNFNILRGKVTGLVADNGTGKSVLLKIFAGNLEPTTGNVERQGIIHYLPQHYGQFAHKTISEALGISDKIFALQKITEGSTETAFFETLADDWEIEEKAQRALAKWNINYSLETDFSRLSGGEKTKTLLASIELIKPDIVLMDEPTNHLDVHSREILYNWVKQTNTGLCMVSHDRALLNFCDTIAELTPNGINSYGGNYDFYEEQKEQQQLALNQKIEHESKTLNLQHKKQREIAANKQKASSRGEKKHQNKGTDKLTVNALKQSSEKTMSTIKQRQTKKLDSAQESITQLKAKKQAENLMKTDFQSSNLHKGKLLFEASNMNFTFNRQKNVFEKDQSFNIYSGDRIALEGGNGSGKSTLIKLLTQQLKPTKGTVSTHVKDWVMIDQEYTMLDRALSVYEQAESFNENALPEHELKIRLNRFLFGAESWDKKCIALSGGEMLRICLCCIMIKNQSPDLIILDEPTNNLDIKNMKVLTDTMSEYEGTLIVISHDQWFKSEMQLNKVIAL